MPQMRESQEKTEGLRFSQGQLAFRPTGPGLYDITSDVAGWLAEQGVKQGQLTLFLRHTSASLVIQENADPDVRRDLERFFQRLVPQEPSLYRHQAEGPDDMPAHIRAALLPAQLTIPVSGGSLLLGTWQGIYLWEHRNRPPHRQVVVTYIGL